MLNAIKIFLFFLVILFLLIFFSLSSGIKINSFSFGNVSISQFYIKLDKKLILTIENIILNNKKTNATSTFEDIKRDIQFFPTLLKLFKNIDIENLVFSDNRVTIKLEDDYLYLDNKFVNIATSFDHSLDNTKFDLYSLYIKDHDLILDGKIDINYLIDKIDFKGRFYSSDVNGKLKVNANRKNIDFFIDSNSFANLHFLKPYLEDMGVIAKSWIYDNVNGSIKLNQFQGSYDLIRNQIVEKSLNGTATIKEAEIKFHKDVNAIKTTSVDVLFENGNLTFNLNKPTYNNIPMDGSFVKIYNLVSNDKGKVIVDIKTKHLLDENIQTILKAFQINIPLIQKDGITKAHVVLDIPYSYPMKTFGTFEIENSSISINDKFDFYTKKSLVELDGTKVKIKSADFKHKEMIDANINLDIDTKTLKANGNVEISSILLKGESDEIINISDAKSNLQLDFNDDVNIDLIDLDTYLSIDEFINIELKDLSKLVKYSKLLQNNCVEKGNLFIKVKDFENIEFKGDIFGDKLQAYLKDNFQNSGIKKLRLDGKIENSVTNLNFENILFVNEDELFDVKTADVMILGDEIKFYANVENLEIPLKKSNQLVKSLELNGILNNKFIRIESLDKSLVYEKFNKEQHNRVFLDGYDLLVYTNQKDKGLEKYKITALNSNIIINDKYKFLANKIDATLDENIVLNLIHNNSQITFEDIDNNNKIIGSNLTDYYLNTIFNKDILVGGIVNLEFTGKNFELDGKINITDSRIKDLAFVNNLITFVNTSPALINPLLAVPSVFDMLTTEGFNLNGYRVNEGYVVLKYSPANNKILVKELKTTGNSVDFEGNGIIDLKTDKLDMNLQLIFLKGYSNIVKHVPVVNYLLLGKNKRVETNVQIVGDINDPKVVTNLLKEGLNAPLDFGKRIINTPKNLLDSIIGDDSEDK